MSCSPRSFVLRTVAAAGFVALAPLLSDLDRPLAPVLAAQTASRIAADPPSLVLERGASATLAIRVVDSEGRTVDEAVRVVGARRALSVETGPAQPSAPGRPAAPGATRATVTALEVGEWEIVVTTVRPGPGGEPLQLAVPVVVDWPPVVRVEVERPGPVFEGGTVTHRATALHADGTMRPGADFAWRTSDAARAEVDAFGHVRGLAPGPVRVDGEPAPASLPATGRYTLRGASYVSATRVVCSIT